MTTSSPSNAMLDELKNEATNSYIDFTPAEIELIKGAADFDEFDDIMHTLVAKYNEHYKQ